MYSVAIALKMKKFLYCYPTPTDYRFIEIIELAPEGEVAIIAAIPPYRDPTRYYYEIDIGFWKDI